MGAPSAWQAQGPQAHSDGSDPASHFIITELQTSINTSQLIDTIPLCTVWSVHGVSMPRTLCSLVLWRPVRWVNF